MGKRLWVVTEFFYPDETATSHILTEIACHLSEKYDVHVICGPQSENSETASEIGRQVKIHRSNVFRLSKDHLLSRTLSFLLLTLVLSLKLLFRSRREDKVLVVTNPAPLLVVVSLLKKVVRYQMVIMTHDVFPENTIPAGIIRNRQSLIYKGLVSIFNRSYARADKIVVLGRDMEAVMKSKLAKYHSEACIRVIPNWADVKEFLQKDQVDQKYLEIQYAGNVGRVQGIPEFLTCFNEADNKSLAFSIWGGGANASVVKRLILECQMQHVSYHGAFIRAEQERIIRQCDICLVSLAEGMYGLGVPSKSYEIMAVGKPILYIGPRNSEIWLVIEENEIGYCFEPSDRQGIVSFLQRLSLADRNELRQKGERAREIAENQFKKLIILKEFYEFI